LTLTRRGSSRHILASTNPATRRQVVKLEPNFATTDGASCLSEDQQHHAHDNEQSANGVKNRQRDYVPNHDEDDA
jgi:hypothetical protein